MRFMGKCANSCLIRTYSKSHNVDRNQCVIDDTYKKNLNSYNLGWIYHQWDQLDAFNPVTSVRRAGQNMCVYTRFDLNAIFQSTRTRWIIRKIWVPCLVIVPNFSSIVSYFRISSRDERKMQIVPFHQYIIILIT